MPIELTLDLFLKIRDAEAASCSRAIKASSIDTTKAMDSVYAAGWIDAMEAAQKALKERIDTREETWFRL